MNPKLIYKFNAISIKMQGVCVCVCVCVNGPVNSQVYMEMQRVKNSKNNLKEKQHWKT